MKKFISAVALLAYLWAGGAPAFAAAIDSNHKLVVQANNTGTPGTFLDTASGAKTITTNGGATQIPYKLNNTAGFFNGSTDFVYVADHADWDVGTGDFTIETFAMFTSTASYQTIVGRNNFSEMRLIVGGGAISLDLMGSPGIISRSWTPTTYTWYHIAVSRSGTTLRLFIDGVQQGANVTDSTNITGTSPLIVGAATTTPDYSFPGWFKEFRFSNTARYTAGFTPTTTQFTSDSNTKLLLHFDNSSGQVLSPCLALDGTGDFLSAPDHADWDFGTGDFTLEGWILWNSVGTSSLMEFGNGGTTGARVVYSGGSVQLAINNVVPASFSITPVAGRWYHIAAVRSSGVAQVYVDGVAGSSGANSANVSSSTEGVRVGSDQSSQAVNGYIKMARISNSARYTAAFTPSQTAFTSDANTKLLVLSTENNGATTLVDSGNTGHTLTANGNAKISYYEDYRNTIFKDDGNTGHKPYGRSAGKQKIDFVVPFGAGVGRYDGSGDYLTLADSADWDHGTGAFYVATWAKVSVDQDAYIFARGNGSVNNGVDFLRSVSAGTFRVYVANTLVVNYTFAPTLNTWYHFAANRTGTSLTFYINGTLVDTQTNSGDITYATSLDIGGASAQPTIGLNGFMENSEISNVSRKTATFNPESSDFSSGRKRAALVI